MERSKVLRLAKVVKKAERKEEEEEEERRLSESD